MGRRADAASSSDRLHRSVHAGQPHLGSIAAYRLSAHREEWLPDIVILFQRCAQTTKQMASPISIARGPKRRERGTDTSSAMISCLDSLAPISSFVRPSSGRLEYLHDLKHLGLSLVRALGSGQLSALDLRSSLECICL